ncbi:DUF1214 domain-containing protein [Pelagibacterium lacus]|uniref:DUF1214 domain-containing protein n=1 Tax=Pelagibacterium lacus TaxID=2282655 RepID=UPI0011C05A9C|nr:DUF1214 domain-containing protein [Pelagibacterium lacus]
MRLLLGLTIALCVGFGASYYALTDGRLVAAVRVGPWAAWPDVGQPDPNPYTRAFLARNGLLQLGYAEGIQFTAFTDSDGQPLDASCHYALAGFVPGHSFWTLEATDLDGANIAASPDLMVLQSERIARTGDGAMAVAVSPRLAPGNWLPIVGGGPFRLQLTLYDAAIFSGANTDIDAMPAIERVVCP